MLQVDLTALAVIAREVGVVERRVAEAVVGERVAGVGMRRASEMDSIALTVRAVPRMTVESSFTGTITIPFPAAAR